jgi:hypothetical protein
MLGVRHCKPFSNLGLALVYGFDQAQAGVTFIRMISDLDIWRAANLVIRQHGADAEIVAAQRADELLEQGDRDGQLLWLRIR